MATLVGRYRSTRLPSPRRRRGCRAALVVLRQAGPDPSDLADGVPVSPRNSGSGSSRVGQPAVFAPGLGARQHNDLAREFIGLERDLVRVGDVTPERLAELTARRLDIEAAEPPILRVLDAMCHRATDRPGRRWGPAGAHHPAAAMAGELGRLSRRSPAKAAFLLGPPPTRSARTGRRRPGRAPRTRPAPAGSSGCDPPVGRRPARPWCGPGVRPAKGILTRSMPEGTLRSRCLPPESGQYW